MEKFTVRQFNEMFSNEDASLDFVLGLIYPDGITCRSCQAITKHHRLTNRKAYSCDRCGSHVYPLAGTIFEKSSTPLKSWFYAMYLMASTRCGISAKQLERELGVTYKTAWRMFRQIRSLFAEEITLGGQLVEMDETYVGGRRRGKRGRGAAGKTIVAGIVERKGRVVAQVVPNVQASTLIPLAQTRIMPSSTVYTDELPSYNRLRSMGYVHKRIHHAARVYVRGDVHTNSIEGFWSLMKRGIGGVYHAVSQKYLQTYLDEYSFRYNRRNQGQPMFESVTERVTKVRSGRYGEYSPIGPVS